MPKVIQMPRRTQPEDEDRAMHRSMLMPEVCEESESLAKVRQWLDLADAALGNEPNNKRQIA